MIYAYKWSANIILYTYIYVIYAYNVVVVMPNSYSRQQTKMFVDRAVKCSRRESERRSWSGRRRCMKWAPSGAKMCYVPGVSNILSCFDIE